MLISPRSGEPLGPAGTWPPSSACSTASISPAVAGQPRDQVAGGEPQQPLDGLIAAAEHLAGDLAAARWPASRPAPCPRPGRGRSPRPGRTVGPRSALPSSASPSASRSPGIAAAPTAGPDLPGLQHRQHQADPLRARSGASPSTCRPSRICASLTSQSQPSTCSRKSSNSASCGRRVEAEVVVELGGLDQRPDLGRTAGSLAGSSAAMLACSSRAARAGPGRRRSPRGSSAAPGGRRSWRAPAAWPGCPRPGR